MVEHIQTDKRNAAKPNRARSGQKMCGLSTNHVGGLGTRPAEKISPLEEYSSTVPLWK